jgi:class 3 adenylate cyclase
MSGDGQTLPSGEVCFLFTDVESSTAALKTLGEHAWAEMQARMHTLVRAAVDGHDGVVVNTEGDGVFAAFRTIAGALRAAAAAQQSLDEQDWPTPLRVRMGLHAGTGIVARDGDYVALAVHQAARIAGAAQGGQVLVSDVVAACCTDTDPPLVDLGLFSVRDFDGPVRLHALARPGVAQRAPRVPAAFDTRLPSYRTAFVGREAEIADIVTRLDDPRPVTLVGPAGIGKTRLAVAVLAQLSTQLTVGPWFVDLTEATAPESVGEAISGAVACPPDNDVGTYLDETLDDRPGLLVLDGADHLGAAVAGAIALLREWCPSLRLLVTADAGLPHTEQQYVAVGALSLPAEASPAAVLASAAGRLFLARAELASPGLALDDIAASVAAITRATSGVPAAIELAAGLCRDRSPALLAEADLAQLAHLAADALPAAVALTLAAWTVPAQPVTMPLARAAAAAVNAGASVESTLDELTARGWLHVDDEQRITVLRCAREVAATALSPEQRVTVLQHLLAEAVEITAGEQPSLTGYAPYAATATLLLRADELDAAARQQLILQLAPWWFGRLGAARARAYLGAALALAPRGRRAAALHLALGDSYPAGSPEIEKHLRESALLLGEHDAVDPAFVARLQQATVDAAAARIRPNDS